jgi:hypothetical protein
VGGVGEGGWEVGAYFIVIGVFEDALGRTVGVGGGRGGFEHAATIASEKYPGPWEI